MSPLAEREKQLLLELARRALIAGVEKREPIQDFPDDKILRQPGGAFVTLHRRGRLRGCVGQLPSKDPLVEVVAHCAKAAALEDPRFKPVPAEELAEIEIELSILSPLEDVTLEKIEAREARSGGQPRMASRRLIAAGSNAIQLAGRAVPGRNLRESGSGTGSLEGSAHAYPGFHCRSFQRTCSPAARESAALKINCRNWRAL